MSYSEKLTAENQVIYAADTYSLEDEMVEQEIRITNRLFKKFKKS